MMRDIVGVELAVNDRVATNLDGYTKSLEVLYVVGFTEKKIKLSRHQGVDKDPYYKFPEQVVIV